MQCVWTRFRAPRLQLFGCILVHVLWSLTAIGAFMGTYKGRLHDDADGGTEGFWVQQGNGEAGWAVLALFLFPMLVHLQFLAPRMINGEGTYVACLLGIPSKIVKLGVPAVRAIFHGCTEIAVGLVEIAEELRAVDHSDRDGCIRSLLILVCGFAYVCMILMAACLGGCGYSLGIALFCVVLALSAALFTCILSFYFGRFVLFLPLVLMDVAARLASSNQRPNPPTHHHPDPARPAIEQAVPFLYSVLGRDSDENEENRFDPRKLTPMVGTVRRVLLGLLAALAVGHSLSQGWDGANALAAVCAMLFTLDLLTWPRLYAMLGVSCCGEDEEAKVKPEDAGEGTPSEIVSVKVTPAQRDAVTAFKAEAEPKAEGLTLQRKRAVRGGHELARLFDMLEAVYIATNAAVAPTPAGTTDLCSLAKRLLQEDALPALSMPARAAMDSALASYLPNDKMPDDPGPTAQQKLLWELEQIERGGDVDSKRSRLRREQKYPADWERTTEAPLGRHPMRAVPLGNVLRESLWTTKPNFFGKQPAGTNYELSTSAKRCSYFVSHAWKDDNAKKVSMMRLFLCLQPLIAHLLVSFLLIAAFLLPLGLAIGAEVNPRDADGHTELWSGPLPAYLLSLLTLCMLFSLLLWIVLAQYNIVPSRLSPWALSSTTLWLDKCCIDQSTESTIAAGVNSFERFLGQCDGMMAFVSPFYFSRLWCAAHSRP